MKKKEFLSTLEEKLQVLNKEERDDILNEYKDTIREKVKNGQTEEEAIKDFGDIDNLVKELLDAYKINPDYNDKNLLEESEHLIKKGADKLADGAKKMYHRFENSNKDINLSLVFEILIKIFLVIIVVTFLKLPFSLFEDLGDGIFDTFFSPFNELLTAFWKLCLMALYIAAIVLIVIAVFKNYFTEEEKEVKDNKEVKNNKEIKNKKVKSENNVQNTLSDVLLLIVKICTILFVIIPLAFMDFFAVLGFIIAIYYLFAHLNFWGLTILLLGVIILITYLIKVLYNLIFKKKSTLFIIPIIGLILTALGSFMFFDMLMNIDYIDKYPYKKNMKVKEEVFTLVNDKAIISHFGAYTKEVDNSLADNEVKVVVTYDKNNYKLDLEHNAGYVNSNCHDNNGEEVCTDEVVDYIAINYNNYDNFDRFKEEYQEFIDNLKDNKVYNYSQSSLDIKVYTNENTLNKITNY